MSKTNWAERYSNEEKVLFERGDWSLAEDGEKIWSLYYQNKCIEPVLDFNKYVLFKNGFVLYYEENGLNSYVLFEENQNKPIFKASGKNFSMEIDKDLLVFRADGSILASFETETLTKIHIHKDEQLGFDI